MMGITISRSNWVKSPRRVVRPIRGSVVRRHAAWPHPRPASHHPGKCLPVQDELLRTCLACPRVSVRSVFDEGPIRPGPCLRPTPSSAPSPRARPSGVASLPVSAASSRRATRFVSAATRARDASGKGVGGDEPPLPRRNQPRPGWRGRRARGAKASRHRAFADVVQSATSAAGRCPSRAPETPQWTGPETVNCYPRIFCENMASDAGPAASSKRPETLWN
jgi:hypothetical protein